MMQITPNSIVPIAHVTVRDRDYNVYISMCTVTNNMHIFKYNDMCCDYEIFSQEGDAATWLDKPLPKY